MAEYIDREALIKEIDEEIEHDTKMYTREQNYYIEKGLRIARKDIMSFSATDIVEVVRCKDCKNRNSFFCPIEKELSTAHWFEDVDYCSYGERKETK